MISLRPSLKILVFRCVFGWSDPRVALGSLLLPSFQGLYVFLGVGWLSGDMPEISKYSLKPGAFRVTTKWSNRLFFLAACCIPLQGKGLSPISPILFNLTKKTLEGQARRFLERLAACVGQSFKKPSSFSLFGLPRQRFGQWNDTWMAIFLFL